MNGVKAQLRQVAHNFCHGQKAGHILFGFFPQLGLVVQLVIACLDLKEVTAAGALFGAAHLAFTGIVGRNGRGPVPEIAVEFLQIIGGGLRSLVRVQTLVHPPVLIQTVFHAGIGHELPGPGGARRRFGVNPVAAFHNSQIGQLVGHAARAEDLAGIGQVLFGTLGKHAHGIAAFAQEILILAGHVRHGVGGHVLVDLSGGLEGRQFSPG